jgi:biopolymer transport protein ExbD
MPQRRRRRSEARLDLNLTPLLDVVLQLITFFMMLVHFGSRIEGATRAVRLPEVPAALPGSDLALDRLALAIDDQGRILAGGETFAGESARAWWTVQAKKRQEGQELLDGQTGELPTQVVIRADRRASYGAVRRAMAEAQESGFARFTLVVLRENRP